MILSIYNNSLRFKEIVDTHILSLLPPMPPSRKGIPWSEHVWMRFSNTETFIAKPGKWTDVRRAHAGLLLVSRPLRAYPAHLVSLSAWASQGEWVATGERAPSQWVVCRAVRAAADLKAGAWGRRQCSAQSNSSLNPAWVRWWRAPRKLSRKC